MSNKPIYFRPFWNSCYNISRQRKEGKMAEKIIIIVLSVFAALAILYLLFGLVCFIFIRVFTRKIKKNSKAVNLLLVQRTDIMKEIVEIAKSNDILLPSDDVENIALFLIFKLFQKKIAINAFYLLCILLAI